jgi:pentatricopeptide repeat protein
MLPLLQINMVPEYPAMLKGMGLIDSAQQKVFESYCARITAAIKAKYMSTAFAIWDEMINGDLFPYNRCPPIPAAACACTQNAQHDRQQWTRRALAYTIAF